MRVKISGSLVGLDVIRLVAAAGVALYHLCYFWWQQQPYSMTTYRDGFSSIGDVTRWGWVGVQIFFVLSGFLIAYTARDRSALMFAKGRLLRLYPAAWICASITFLFASAPSALPAYFRSLLLSPVGPWVDGVYWTLGVEVIFYAVTCCAIACRISVVQLGYGLIAWSGTFYALRIADFLSGRHINWIFARLDNGWGGLTLLENGCFFGLGIMLWAAYAHTPSRTRRVAIAVGLGCCIVQIAAAARYFLSQHGGAAAEILAPLAIWCVALAAICASITHNDRITRFIAARRISARLLGLMTYPLYLIHSVIGRDIMVAVDGIGPLAGLMLATAAVVVIAWLVVRAEEHLQPSLERLLRFERRRPIAAQLP